MFGALDYFPGTTEKDFNSYTRQVRRRRFDDDDEIYAEDDGNLERKEFTTIIGKDEYYYEFQYIEDFPKKMRVTGKGIEKGKSVVVGVCLPEGASEENISAYIYTPDDITFGGDSMKFVDSMEEVKSDLRMRKVYLKGRMLYFRMSSKKARDMNWDREDNKNCAGAFCPKFVLYMSEQLEYFPCFDVTEDQLNKKITVGDHSCTLPASQPDPDWGARDTLASEDGSWGQWSGWSECCNEAGSDIVLTTRYRLCDDPAPRGSGADCTGESLQSAPCPNSCPVDGELSGWSDYTDCFCDGIAEGSTGVRTKTQECINAENGGQFCKGDSLRHAMCRKTCGEASESSVDGTFSSWGEWTECFCGGIAEGSLGARTRSRTCEGTANFGYYCSGVFEEMIQCDADCFPGQ